MTGPPLIPAPAELRYPAGPDAFIVDAATEIIIAQGASKQTLFSARQTQAAVHDAIGLRLVLRKTGLSLSPLGERLNPGVRGNAPPERRIALQVSETDTGPEGYELVVGARAITVRASHEAGLFYGVQTLRQLVKFFGARIPELVIHDRPVLPHRGLMLDVSRGKVPTLETLYALVDGLAAYKYNHLQLYTEHTFHFPSHPEIAAGTDPLTADDILALDAYCHDRHIELVPNLQSFGHHRHLLSLPRYSHLDEVGWRWSLTPAREETYQLLDELYADMLPAFRSGWLNVDCDETYDLGTGQSSALAHELGRGRLYVRHILRLRELAAKHGRRIMLWADILHHYPELVPELPDDVLLLDWEYEAYDHYPTTEALGRSGRAFWVCPGTSSWNTLFPRLDNAVANIRQFVRDGLAAGATGMLLTDWGDYGHYQPLSVSWYAYAFGAATAWTGGGTSPEEFDAAFGPLFLDRPPGDRSMLALRRLGHAVGAPGIGIFNRSLSVLALFDDPLNGRVLALADPTALAELHAAAVEAIAGFVDVPDPHLRWDYGFVARLIVFGAEKVLSGQHFADAWRQVSDSDVVALLDQRLSELATERERMAALKTEFEAVWLRHARRSEIHLSLGYFETLDQRYAAAIDWLADQRNRCTSGQAIDREMGSYSPGPYFPVWEQGVAALRRLVELVGPEALPRKVLEAARVG